MQKNIFKNKKILITGCTGFTGGWLILYFKLMGAIIYGYSKKPPFKNSLFQTLNLKKKIYFQEGDVLDDDNLRKFYKKSNPDGNPQQCIDVNEASEPIQNLFNQYVSPSGQVLTGAETLWQYWKDLGDEAKETHGFKPTSAYLHDEF